MSHFLGLKKKKKIQEVTQSSSPLFPTVLCILGGGSGLGEVGPHASLVHGVQQVFGVQRQCVSGGQHLPQTLLLQRRDGVLLGQSHLTDQLPQILVQQFLGAFDLTRGRRGDCMRQHTQCKDTTCRKARHFTRSASAF